MQQDIPHEPLEAFDLTELALKADRARRFRVRLVNGQRTLGVALVVVGVYFFLAPPAGSLPPYSLGPALFIGIGAVIAGVASWVRAAIGHSARRLVLSRESLAFEDIPGGQPVRLQWQERGFRLDIHDFRQIRVADPRSRSRGYDFIIHPSRGPQTAVPLQAVEAIVRLAEQHGLRVSRSQVSIGAKAPMTRVSIRPVS